RLLAGAVLNAEVRVAATPTLSFMSTSVSTTPEHEGGDHTDSLDGEFEGMKCMRVYIVLGKDWRPSLEEWWPSEVE
ncbi:hypothetical protein Tco_1527366, partial [Tanacetum coccineum]